MTPAGIPVGTLVGLAREASTSRDPDGPIVVLGPLAAQLARALAEGGDPSLVRAGSGEEPAAVLVCVLGGDPTPEQLAVLRAAVREGTPVVGVQTAEPREVPYIPALDVVDVPPGQGFPVATVAAAIARVGGDAAAPLAPRLPVLREPVVRSLVGGAVARAAAIGAWPLVRGAHLPLILAVQLGLLRDVLAATEDDEPEVPRLAGVTLRPELGLAVAAGLAARGAHRALPWRGAAVRAALAGGVTLAIGVLAAARGTLRRRG